MREGWGIVNIGEACEILDNKRKPITKKDRIEGDYPYYGATGILSYVEGYIFDEKLVLLGEDGAKWESGDRSAFIINGKTWVNNHAHVLRPNRKVLIDEWLVYNLNFQNLMTYVSGMTVPKLNQGNMKKIQISVPQIEEQKEIVSILDDAFASIDKAKANIERNIENAKELFQSKLNEIFSQTGKGWENKTLIDICKFIDYRGRTPKKTDNGVKLITAKNVRMGYLKNNPEEFIDIDEYDNWMTRGIPEKGDVLFTTEAPLANVALLNTSEKNALAQRIITLCPDRSLLSGEYLCYCLQSKPIQKKILDKGTGATVTGIKSKLLKKIEVQINSLKEQQKIVNLLDTLNNLTQSSISNYEKELDNLEELKKSILQKAFSGELTNKSVAA